MYQSVESLLKPGQVVHVRARQYLVEEVSQEGEDARLRLACLDDDAQGEPLSVLWGCEVDARIVGDAPWDRVAHRGFDDPSTFSAYLHTLHWHCVTATDPELFQAPYRAGIQVKDYQLEPLRKALKMPRVNLFIADDVGLGKTVEAGLILRELLLRQKVQRVVVACPPSVLRQWQDEMEQRFGLMFVIFDRAFVSATRQERGYTVNPWKTHTRFIISHALLRDEAYSAPLRDWLDDANGGPAMLILDEAHNAAPASSAKYAVDSQLTREVRDLSPRFAHRLFLSATPHNGHSNSFSSLLEMLDPQRFTRGVPVTPKLLKSVMVRRLKADLIPLTHGEFPKRVVVPIQISGLPKDAPSLALASLLESYRQARLDRLRLSSEGGRRDAMLVWISLQKRLLSSIEAFYRTLKVHAAALQRAASQPLPASSTLQATLLLSDPDADDDRADLDEAEVQAEQVQLVERATRSSSRPSPQELDLIKQMEVIAQIARLQPDPRIDELQRWLKAHLCPDLGQPGAKWLPTRVLIFTEYTDTKAYLERELRRIVEGSHLAAQRIGSFHGGMGDDAREEIKAAFNSAPDQHPLRVLIATDAAREGVNLQNHCAHLFHFDIPWNPGRMEQRNGRIDRKLQRAAEVFCYYFIFTQRPEDRVLQALVHKTKTILSELGSIPTVIERKLSSTFDNGIDRASVQQLALALEQLTTDPSDSAKAKAAASSTADAPLLSFAPSDSVATAELASCRKRQGDLRAQLDKLKALLQRAQRHLDFDEAHLTAALSTALTMLGAPCLSPLPQPPGKTSPSAHLTPGAWTFPALDQLSNADPTWANTLDPLRYPRRKRADKLDRWRRESKLKSVAFSDSGNLDEHTAHLHLEHRVVQRLLGRFLAQGFIHHDLSRACVCLTSDPVGSVVVVGRLSVFGPGATRLHEEVLLVSGQLSLSDSSPKPQTIDVYPLWQTLRAALSSPIPASTALQKQLVRRVSADITALRPTLDAHAEAALKAAKAALKARAEKEARALRDVLTNQRARLLKWQADSSGGQLSLDFSTDERRQLEADRLHVSSRLRKLDDEIASEPGHIRALYKVKTHRIEPIGVIYLWPKSS
jgi:superfamily II DNA/RNA helicase